MAKFRIERFFKKLDRFGYEVEMHFEGSSSFKTIFGALVSLIVYILILINALNITADFFNNGN